MAKYYPSSKTAMLRNEIHTFQQEDGESLGEAWDRYQDLIASYPHHGIPEWYITQTFFQTLLPRTKEMVNASAGGGFDHLSDEEGTALIKKMVDSEANYGSRGNMLRRNGKFPKENASNSETNAKLDLLTKQFEKFSRNQVNQAATLYGAPMEEVAQVSSCELCGGSGHTYDLCGNNYNGVYEENVQEMIKNMQLQHSQEIANFAKATQQEQANLRATFLKDMREMESRMASHAMANPQRLPGCLLAQGQSSKDASNSHHAHAVVLRSGVELEDPYKDLVVEMDEDPMRDELKVNDEEESSPVEQLGKASEDKNGKKACEDLSRKVIEEGKDVDGYVEDLPYEEEAIEEVPLQQAKKVTKNSTPPKVAKRIGIQNLAPTSMTLQLADRSVKHPIGVLEDVPVKVGKLLIPADFVVLDIPEDSHTPIILGRPFLATGGVLIDVKNGRLTFQIEGNNVEFNLPNLMKGPSVERLSTIEVIDEVVHEVARDEAEMEEVFQISLHDEAMKEDHEVNDELLKKKDLRAMRTIAS
ncbi:uncharacterized protein LOC141614301 [Silene latifolia]|uniref:uncharacterized protein LOC141614301 n=1 Tax=Silene latifolia TaxID=37657 RepID=UPI003D77C266